MIVCASRRLERCLEVLVSYWNLKASLDNSKADPKSPEFLVLCSYSNKGLRPATERGEAWSYANDSFPTIKR
jgi:hypothetical protein